ncbi:MAG: hypothetical protein GWO08_02160 [Gammaproteobacteria bacterium]|nr:hypothetical protein [Gammaproteobacteria bacterium]
MINLHQKSDWHRTIRRYLVFATTANLVWEFLHLPLYTIWQEETLPKNVYAAIHCTAGDLIIAVCALMLSLLIFGNQDWPKSGFSRVLTSTVILGLAYTIFSEWLNIEIRKSWAYSELMPVVPILETGLSPIAQWIVLPISGLNWAANNRKLDILSN